MNDSRLVLENQDFDAFLFDMDGTLINSVPAANRVWRRWAQRHGLDADALLATIHGVRAIDTVKRQNLSGIDPEAEARGIMQDEIDDVDGVVEIPGAAALLRSLPVERWAIVTSAPRALARARLHAAGIALPSVLICAENVQRGKPDPEGFHLAASLLGVDIARCLVWEDSPAGLAAGRASGAQVAMIAHHADGSDDSVDAAGAPEESIWRQYRDYSEVRLSTKPS